MKDSVGETLRAFRIQRGLTLSEVARRSENAFKVSSLGAYERGDRAITFERLQRLAAVYGVDIRSLLADAPAATIDLVALERRIGIVIDLARFRVLDHASAEAVMDFGNAIKTMRKESTSSVIIVRRSDASLLAANIGCDPAEIDEVLQTEFSLPISTQTASLGRSRSGSGSDPGLADAGGFGVLPRP